MSEEVVSPKNPHVDLKKFKDSISFEKYPTLNWTLKISLKVGYGNVNSNTREMDKKKTEK